jgi:hypothetical protein
MEDLVKLVEGVKLVDLSDGQGEGNAEDYIPDGRVWEEGTGIQPVIARAETEDEATRVALLHYSARISNGLYVVDVDRTK